MAKNKRTPVFTDDDIIRGLMAVERREIESQAITPQNPAHLLANQLVLNCEKGNVDTVKRLLELGADPNTVRNLGTPLCAATRSPNPVEIIKILIAAKADPIIEEHPGWHPLFCAVGNNQVAAARILIESDADINQRCSSNGWTALMNAACFGHVECAVELLALGADITIKSEDGLTAIDIARGNGRNQVVQVFRKYLEVISKR